VAAPAGARAVAGDNGWGRWPVAQAVGFGARGPNLDPVDRICLNSWQLVRWQQVAVAVAAVGWGLCRCCGVALSPLPPLPSRPYASLTPRVTRAATPPTWPPRGFGEALFGATVVRSGSPVVMCGNNKWTAVAPAATAGFVRQGDGGSLLLSWGPRLALCWVFLGESLGDGDAGAASPVEGVVLPITVLHGRKPRPFRTGDGGVLDVTLFLKASLLLAGAGQRIKVFEVSLVKNRSCLEWGVSCLATTARRIFPPPGPMFVVIVVFHLALCCLSWGVGAARHLC
jgi:hypothetical protein